MTKHRYRFLWIAIVTISLSSSAQSWAQPTLDPDVFMAGYNGDIVRLGNSADPGLPPPAQLGVRSDPLLLHSYLNWDNWNLDTSGVRDAAGNLQFAVRLWQYGDRNEHFDRYVINSAGELIDTDPNWIGVADQAVVDVNGQYDFLRPSATTQRFGITDSLNNVHVVTTSMESTGWEILYCKYDSNGTEIISPKVITTEAHPCNFYLQPVITSTDTVIITWTRDTDDICAISSSDSGVTWSDLTVLVEWNGEQACCSKTVVGSDDSLHFVWRELDWSTYTEKLWYAKVRADWTLAVAPTSFFDGPCWYPFVSIDQYDNLHVTYTTNYELATDIYYTRLNGELDLDGAPATDALLSEVQERVFLTDPDTVHYPLNLVDEFGTVHVIYEEGDYGRFTDKDLYYCKICSLTGDLDCDEDVDLSDLATLLAAYGACEDDTAFEGLADLDNSGCVDLSDLAALLANYGSGG